MKNRLILRDVLAVDRTQLANQRTLLSFIRTGLYLIITGFGINEFSKASYTYWISIFTGSIGIIVAIIGIINYFSVNAKMKRKLRNAE